MSEKKITFDAAIHALNVAKALTIQRIERDVIEAAIRVLEAAGRVDKEHSVNYMVQVGKYFTFEPAELDADIYVGIRVLLEALPDKEQK